MPGDHKHPSELVRAKITTPSFFLTSKGSSMSHVGNFEKLTVDCTAIPSLLLFKFLKYRKAIRAFFESHR